MKNKKRTQLILGACKEVKKRGWKIVDYDISRERMECPPLGAVLLISNESFISTQEHLEILRELLNCDDNWLYGFSLGWAKFLKEELSLNQKKGFKVGRLFRKRFQRNKS